jgi:hypothetical protein
MLSLQLRAFVSYRQNKHGPKSPEKAENAPNLSDLLPNAVFTLVAPDLGHQTLPARGNTKTQNELFYR